MKKGMWRFRILSITKIAKSDSQIKFSIAAIKLDVLVTSTPIIGRNRKVVIIYGALQAIQKYVSNFVGGVAIAVGFSLGQLKVSITETASN